MNEEKKDYHRPDLYDVAMTLYGSHTGSNDSAYASWSGYERTKEQDIAYLRQRLADWGDSPSWAVAVDNAFKAWVEAVLDVVDDGKK